MGTRLRLAGNILSNWGGLALSMLVSFFLAPYVLRKLGDDGYGVWMLTLSLTGYLGLLDLGIRSSVVRYVSKCKAEADYKSFNQVINTALVTFSLAGLSALAIGLALGLTAGRIFNIPANLATQATGVIIAMSATLAISFPTGVFASTLVGVERFDLLNLSSSIGNLLRAGLILLVFPLKADLITLGLLTFLSSVIGCGLTVYFAFRREPQLKVNLKLFDAGALRKIFNYGIYSFLIIVGTRVAYYSDNTVIGIFGSAEEITFFAIGAIAIEFLRRIVNALTSVMTPVASGLESRGSEESLPGLLKAGTKYSLLVILPISAILLIMGKTILGLWMGPEYAQKSYLILLVLLIPQIYSFSQFATEEILLGTGRHKLFSFVAVAEALSNLALSIILIKPFGILGVALGTTIPNLLFRVILSPVFIRQCGQVSYFQYLKESFLAPVAICIPVVILAFSWEHFLKAESLWELGLQALFLLGIYYLLAWHFAVEERMKRSIGQRLKGRRARDSAAA